MRPAEESREILRSCGAATIVTSRKLSLLSMLIRTITFGALMVVCLLAPHSEGAEPLRRLPPVRDDGTALRTAPRVARAPETAAAVQQLPLPDQRTESISPLIPWWQHTLTSSLRSDATYLPIDPQALLVAAIAHSDHIRALQQTPAILEEEIIKAQAAFDVAAFVESKFDDLSEPVGSTLTTGGPPRFNDHNFRTTAGLKKRTQYGGAVELSQRIGMQDTNSLFFVPNDQSQTRLTLEVSQPLMKQNGRQYARSVIVLAELDTETSRHVLASQLQDHLFDVTQAYWDLVYQRSLYMQRRRSVDKAREIHQQLQRRRDLDALPSQLARARAAVATREAATIRAEADVRNAEARIRALTNSPQFNGEVELLPTEMPTLEPLTLDLSTAMQESVQKRPEVTAAIQRVRAAQVRTGLARNEVLPTLNLILQAYVSGLQGDYAIGQSLQQQFDSGAPSYTAGLVFQMPLGNHAALAEHRKRKREVAQLVYELNSTLKTVSLEVEVAVRDVHASYHEMLGRHEAMKASQEELQYLLQRWRALPGDDRQVSFLLEETLNAQDRLVEAESAYAAAQSEYARALARLQRATGAFLQVDTVPAAAAPQIAESPATQGSR